MNRLMSRDDLVRWLQLLLQERILVAPMRVQGLVLFQPVAKVEDIAFDFANTTLPPKVWFLPPTEALFSVRSWDGHAELVPATVEQRAVIFGVRPCDAKGITLMDSPFLEEPGDALYRERRAQTTIIGLSCRQAQPECFCTSVGSAANDPRHVDILLTEVEDGYIVQVVTDKGKALLPDGLVESEREIPAPPVIPAVPIQEVAGAIKEAFSNPYWERLAERCLHCQVCAYVCPTCYCFDVRDYPDRGNIERVRSWDSCQSPGFTRIAGGYNPRPTKGARLRQRFYHKLLYFPERYQDIACVGCGRCVKACPVNIDIREVISDLQQLGATSG